MKIRTWMIPVVIVIILGGSIALAQATGYWQTEGRENGHGAHESSTDIRESDAGEAITGSTTVAQVLDSGVDANALEVLIGPWEDTGMTVRAVAQANGHSFGQVKVAVGQLVK